jgi:hypothetical protein
MAVPYTYKTHYYCALGGHWVPKEGAALGCGMLRGKKVCPTHNTMLRVKPRKRTWHGRTSFYAPSDTELRAEWVRLALRNRKHPKAEA